MGMSTHIQAFIPDTDSNYQRHKKVVEMCAELKVSLPMETSVYFNANFPNNVNLEDKLEIDLIEGEHYAEWVDRDAGSQGYEVNLTKLPSGVTKLRFYNNW